MEPQQLVDYSVTPSPTLSEASPVHSAASESSHTSLPKHPPWNDVEDDEAKIPIEVLNCTICLKPLRSDMKTCVNAHFCCRKCHEGTNVSCPSCKGDWAESNELFLVKILDFAKVHCKFEDLGCKEFLPYHLIAAHTNICPHTRCFCPERKTICRFSGAVPDILDHGEKLHNWNIINFEYDIEFTIRVNYADASTVLKMEEHMLVLAATKKASGTAFDMLAVRARDVSTPQFKCAVKFSGGGIHIMRPVSTNLSRGLNERGGGNLYFEYDQFNESEDLEFHITISIES